MKWRSSRGGGVQFAVPGAAAAAVAEKEEQDLSAAGGEAADEDGSAASDGPSRSWEESRGPRAAALLAEGRFCDLVLLVGEPPERVPAARLLLAAASPPLSQQLRLAALPAGSEVRLPHVRAAAARALVAYSCGAPRPFEGVGADDAQFAQAALSAGFPRAAVCDNGDAAAAAGPAAAAVAGGRGRGRDGRRASPWTWARVAAALAWLVVPVAALSAYWPTVSFNPLVGGLFMDDAMIQKNIVVVDTALDVRRLLRTDYWGLEMFDPNTWTHKSFRPLTVLTFRWNYLWHGFNSAGFHVTNVALHAAASLQLGVFGLYALRLPLSWSALLAALFAVHPVHTENICYIVGRADILCAQALLLAAQLYLPCALGKACWSWARLPAAVILIIISGLFKETGFTFFGLLVAWEVLGLTRRRAGAVVGRWLRIGTLLAVGSACCAARLWYTSGTKIARMDPFSNPVSASDDPYVRKLSYALVHGMYMRLVVWPTFLCYDYSMDAVPLVQTLRDARLMLPLAAYLALVQVACVTVHSLRTSARPRRLVAEGMALGLGVFLLGFLPMANLLFPVGTLVGERLLYIPSAGALCAGVSLVYARTALVAGSGGGAKQGGGQAAGLVAKTLLLLAVAACWLPCYRRVQDWRSVESITLVDGLKQLRSSRTQYNLANLYMVQNRHDEALLAYQRSIATDPEERDAQPLYHAGQILLYRGQHVEAESYLHKAVSGYFSPLVMAEEEVWHDYALALWHVGRAAEAAQNFQNAIITNPHFPKGYNNLACALVLLGLSSQPPNVQAVQEGLGAAERALALQPGSPLYWRNAAVLLALTGDAQGAQGAWARFQQLDPASAAAAQAAGTLPRDCVWEFYFR